MSAPTRRRLLGGAAVLATAPVAPIAATPVHPDADLLAACDEYLRLQRAFSAYVVSLPNGLVPDDPQFAMLDPEAGLIERIVALRATTAEGHTARARCWSWSFLVGHREAQDDPAGAAEDRFQAAGLRDLIQMERGGPAPVPLVGAAPEGITTTVTPSPDAGLLAACAELDHLEHAYIAAHGEHPTGSPEENALEAERDRIIKAEEPLIDRICETRAVTREGQAARARSLALWDAELMKPQPDTIGRLTQAIVRDLIG